MSDVLSIDTLASRGGFTTGAPVAKSIQWTDSNGEQVEATVYVRPRSYRAAVADIQASLAESSDAAAIRIASTICDAEGEPIFSREIINGEAEPGPLSADLTFELLRVIGEVNNPKSQTSSTQT